MKNILGIIAFIVAIFTSFVYVNAADSNLPDVARYSRSTTVVAPEGTLLIAEHTRPDYRWVKYHEITNQDISDYRIKDVFTCSLPCEDEIYSAKSPGDELTTLFTTTIDANQELVYTIGDIHRGETLVRNGVIVTPTVLSSGDGWTQFSYSGHAGTFTVQVPETRFGMFLVRPKVVIATVTPTAVVETATATATIVETVVVTKPTVTSTPTSPVIVTPTTVVTLTATPTKTATSTVVPSPTPTSTPVVEIHSMSVTGFCHHPTHTVQLTVDLSSPRSCSLSVLRNETFWLNYDLINGVNHLVDHTPEYGNNIYTLTATCSQDIILPVETFICDLPHPAGLTPIPGEPAYSRESLFLPLTKR